MDLDLCC